MFNVTTKYDNVNGERRKVFIIRGDEAYAKTVDVVLSYARGSHISDSIRGFPATLTARLYRNVGDSVLEFYDGDEPIDTVVTHDWQSSYSLPVRLSWGEDHKITARYKSNAQTMGKKSKSITVHEAIPSDYVPTITFTSSTQINQGDSYTATGRVQFLGENVINGTEIVISVDGEIVSTVETSNGLFSCSLGSLDKGTHTVTAETIQSETMNAKSQSLTLHNGYEVTILQYPQTLITDVPSEFKISVKTHNGNPVVGGVVQFNGVSYSTNSQGIATFTLSSIETGRYRASYNGSYSEYVDIGSVTLPDIYVTSDARITTQNGTLPIDINIPNGSGFKVKVHEDNIPVTELTLDKNGSATYNYDGADRGEVAIKFTSLNLSKTINILDTVAYYSRNDGNNNLKILNHGVTNFHSSSTRNLELNFNPQGHVEFESIHGDTDGNVLEMKISSLELGRDSNPVINFGGKRVDDSWAVISPYWNDVTVKFVYRDGNCYRYVNGRLDWTTEVNSPPTAPLRWGIENRIWIGTSNPVKLKISELKIYKE